MRALLLAGVVVLGWNGAALADVTSTDTWSFTDQSSNTLVSGTLSGIQNGTGLSPSGLIATVTQALYADLLGSYTIDPSGSAASSSNTYNATGGVVYSASFLLTNAFGSRLYFSTNPSTGPFIPELLRSDLSEVLFNSTTGTTFAAALATPTAVPEPASLALLGMSVAGMAAVRRRRAG